MGIVSSFAVSLGMGTTTCMPCISRHQWLNLWFILVDANFLFYAIPVDAFQSLAFLTLALQQHMIEACELISRARVITLTLSM